MPSILPLASTPQTVQDVTREAHALFSVTLASGVVWTGVSRAELLTMQQGPSSLITLELREAKTRSRATEAQSVQPDVVENSRATEPEIFGIESLFENLESPCHGEPEAQPVKADVVENSRATEDGSNILELLGMVEPGQDATSGESGAEDLSSLSSDGEDSDAEDVFQLNAMKVEHLDRPYTNFFYTDGNKQQKKL